MISSQWSYRRIFNIDLKLHKNYKFRIIWVENIYVLFMQAPIFLICSLVDKLPTQIKIRC